MGIMRGILILLVAAVLVACDGGDGPAGPTVQVTGANVQCPEGTHPVVQATQNTITVTVGDTIVYCRADQPPVVVTPIVMPVPTEGG